MRDESDVLKSLGGTPEEINSALAAFAQNAQVFSARYAELLRDHPSQWVGVYAGTVSAISDTLSGLLAALETKGIPASAAVVRFVGKEPSTIML